MRTFGAQEAAIFVLIWIFGWAFFGLLARRMRDKAKLARLEMAHKERMAAMEKGIPLPELPDLEHHFGRGRDPRQSLLLGGILCIFMVCISVKISNSSSRVPKPPGKITSALARIAK